MFNASNILIYGHPIIHSFFIQWTLMIVRACKPIEVPGRFDEGIHGILFPLTRPTALGALGLHKFLQPGEGRLAHSSDFHVEWKDDRKIFFRNGHGPTLPAVDDGDRCPPITLP